MGLCYLLVCRDCRENTTIGKNGVIWTKSPDTLRTIELFLTKHQGHHLVYCDWNQFDDFAPVEDDYKWTSVEWRAGAWWMDDHTERRFWLVADFFGYGGWTIVCCPDRVLEARFYHRQGPFGTIEAARKRASILERESD